MGLRSLGSAGDRAPTWYGRVPGQSTYLVSSFFP